MKTTLRVSFEQEVPSSQINLEYFLLQGGGILYIEYAMRLTTEREALSLGEITEVLKAMT